MWKTALVLLQAILLQVVAQEEQIQCVGSDVFRTSNGSCSSCQSLSCPEGYEPNQNCGNGLPLEGGHCVQCINSSKFSKYGDRCYPCSICVERVVAVRCNGVNDTVCGDTCNVGYFQEGNRCISCSLHLNPDQHEECASSTVRFVKDEDPTIQLSSKSGEELMKQSPFVVYVVLFLCIVLIFLLLILCYCCCYTREEQARLKYGPWSRRERDIDVEIQPEEALLQQSGQADQGNVQREEVIGVERQQEIALLQQNGQADEGNVHIALVVLHVEMETQTHLIRTRTIHNLINKVLPSKKAANPAPVSQHKTHHLKLIMKLGIVANKMQQVVKSLSEVLPSAYPGFSNPGGANYYLSGAPPSVGAQRTRKFLVLIPPRSPEMVLLGLEMTNQMYTFA
ncbi:hypothetical protein BSL78_10829 [Apostichopus japonicus]|uniref:TNFR-Cys domain-containing protein n=1 Tax=Stichopus japonicus TaxID=307972 RepID=A0A2G8KWI6_STIJA|nr:hypothetical protein BSL78_10829 [Apostichopus japonicus]